MSRSTSRITFSCATENLKQLTDELGSRLKVPPHQREYCWKLPRQRKFINTIRQGMPCGAVIIREDGRGSNIEISLEDGQQRITTAKKYMADEFEAEDGIKFSGLSEADRTRFENYMIPAIRYKGSTDIQAVQIFNLFQNGVPLTVGERLWCMMENSPLVKYTKETLMTPGEGLYDRASLIWGERDYKKDKRRKDLVNAVALVAGLWEGPSKFSKKWGDLENLVEKEFTPADQEKVTKKLKTIINIFEQVNLEFPITKKTEYNKYWNWGNYVGFMAFSLTKNTSLSGSELFRGWVNFLREIRLGEKKLEDTLLKDLSGARSWNTMRWQKGYGKVFPNDVTIVPENNGGFTSEESESENESDED
jgi:hypothetical protein